MFLEISPEQAAVLKKFLREQLTERLPQSTGDTLHQIYLQLNDGAEHPTWVNRFVKKKRD